jgi:two-component system, OmpR family, heavy metal sensor histidine kinase CusS
MKMNFRSLRVRLSLLYIVFTLVSMSSLGVFSYWYLSRALASSRQQTMERREARVLTSINTWPAKDTSLSLSEKLRLLSVSVADTDAMQIYDLDGKLIYASPGPDDYKVEWPHQSCIDPCYDIVRKNHHTIRTLNHVVVLGGLKVRLSLSGATSEHFEILEMIRNSYLISCPLLLLASVAGGLALSHRALEPVHSITSKARTIGIQDLQHRLPVPQTGDELQVLAETWNDLLVRLEVAVSRLTQFTGDISHDLRTTITVMLSTAEVSLRRQRSENEYRAALGTIVRECHATSQLLDDLLAAARADIVRQNIERAPVDLSEVARRACEHLYTKAEVKRQSLRSRICDDTWTMGDSSMLGRMVTILVDNAIKYTPEGGTILVSVNARDGCAELEVADTGIGIPPDSIPRVFDRFYRVDDSRCQDDGSSGLGLAIAKWIVEAHGATIQVASTTGSGSTFTVAMPLRPHGLEMDSLRHQTAAN